MNDLWIPEKDIYVTYPSYWDELRTKKEVLYVSDVLHQVFMQRLDVFGAKKLIIDCFLNRKNGINKPSTGDAAWNYWANESRLSETVNWVFDVDPKLEVVPDDGYTINPKLTRQHIDRIRINGDWYYGPGDLLGSLSFIEFKESMICIERYIDTREEDWLTRLAALLYCRRKFPSKEKERLRYSDVRIEDGIKAMQAAPSGLRFWCFLFFTGCLNYLREEPVLLDGREYRLGCLFNGNGGISRDDTGLTGVLFSMAESGVFGSLEETSHANYYDVALRLYQLHKQAEDMRSNFKK